MYQSNIYEYLENLTEEKLLICKDDKEAVQVRDIAVLLGFDTFVLPDLRVSVGEDLRAYGEDIQLLFTQLASFYKKQKHKYEQIIQTRSLAFLDAYRITLEESIKALKGAFDEEGYNYNEEMRPPKVKELVKSKNIDETIAN